MAICNILNIKLSIFYSAKKSKKMYNKEKNPPFETKFVFNLGRKVFQGNFVLSSEKLSKVITDDLKDSYSSFVSKRLNT